MSAAEAAGTSFATKQDPDTAGGESGGESGDSEEPRMFLEDAGRLGAAWPARTAAGLLAAAAVWTAMVWA